MRQLIFTQHCRIPPIPAPNLNKLKEKLIKTENKDRNLVKQKELAN